MAARVSTAYAVCSILQRCLSFITLPLFTRLLTTEQYGQLTIYLSWEGILTLFLTLNLAYGSFSTAMVKFENDREGYISSIEGICLALSGIFLVIYLPFRNFWNYWFQLPTNLILLMIVELLCTTAILLWKGKKRFEFKYVSVITVTLLMSVIAPIVAFFLVIHAEEKGYARIIGFALVHIVVGGSFFIFNAIRGKKIFDRTYWKYALGFNIPLLAYYLSQIVFNQSDRIMISHMVGTDKAAVYGVAYHLAMVLHFVLNSINNSYVPWYFGKIKEGKMRENQSVSLAIAGLMALLLLGIIWLTPEIVQIMAGSQYMEAIYVVPPVALSLLLLFYSQLFINVEFYYEEKKKLVKASVGAAIANFVLNLVFIRWFGFIAAAYTTLISYLLFAFANNRAMKEVLTNKGIKDEGFSYKGLVGLFIVFTTVAYIGVGLYDFFIPRITVFDVASIIIFARRKKLAAMYRKMKAK